MSGTLVPMGTGAPAGTHQNFKILGTAGYRVPRKFQKLGTAGYRIPRKFQKLGTQEISKDGYRWPVPIEFQKIWVPMGTGYQPDKKLWVPMGTEYQPEKNFWVPMGTGYQSENFFWVPMGTGYRPNVQRCRPMIHTTIKRDRIIFVDFDTTDTIIHLGIYTFKREFKSSRVA